MFYYAWLIGLPLAVFFGVAISMWSELREETEKEKK